MEFVEGYDHQSGTHCGAAALRNVTAYYDWTFSEAACFGIGGGTAFVRYDLPDSVTAFRASPLWLERAFFERLGVQHRFQEGDDAETAWENVTGHVDDDDPVVLFLDPAELAYLPEDPPHLPPHVAVLVGYDDETVQLSDGAVSGRTEIDRSTLAAAWTSEGPVGLDREYLVVTRARTTTERHDAAAAGLRQAATYMLDPLQIKRDARGPGQEGIPALRSFAEYVGTLPDRRDTAGAVRTVLRSIDEHGDRAAYRGLFADSLAELGQGTGLPGDLADRMDDTADRWAGVADRLSDVLATGRAEPATVAEAATALADIADQEADIYRTLREELREVDGD
jgi:hypothetical protein